MFEPDANLWPGRRNRKAFRPFENDDGRRGEDVFHAERFEIVEFFDAEKVAMKDLLFGALWAVNVEECERGTRDIFFGGGAKAADDSLGERGFAAAKIAGEKNHQWRFYARSKFPAPGDGFFGGLGEEFFRHRTESPEEHARERREWSQLLFARGFRWAPLREKEYRRRRRGEMRQGRERGASRLCRIVR